MRQNHSSYAIYDIRIQIFEIWTTLNQRGALKFLLQQSELQQLDARHERRKHSLTFNLQSVQLRQSSGYHGHRQQPESLSIYRN
jgi:hypothetical protein